jgi:hypothetical protein
MLRNQNDMVKFFTSYLTGIDEDAPIVTGKGTEDVTAAPSQDQGAATADQQHHLSSLNKEGGDTDAARSISNIQDDDAGAEAAQDETLEQPNDGTPQPMQHV